MEKSLNITVDKKHQIKFATPGRIGDAINKRRRCFPSDVTVTTSHDVIVSNRIGLLLKIFYSNSL